MMDMRSGKQIVIKLQKKRKYIRENTRNYGNRVKYVLAVLVFVFP